MRILITGGAGFVGRATVRAAVEAGHQVRIVSRDAWPSGSMFEKLGVDVVTGDAQSPAVMERSLDGMDALKNDEKKKQIAEDEHKRLDAEVQKLTDDTIKEIDAVVAAKDREILQR